MAANFITLSDFKGYYSIDYSDRSETMLNTTLEEREKYYLVRALGLDLYKLLIADLSGGVPQSQRFTDLVDGKEFTDYLSNSTEWLGLKQMLVPLCFYDLKKELVSNSTKMGFRKPDIDNGTIISLTETYQYMNERFNNGVSIWVGDFWNFMYSNKDLYSEWLYTRLGTKQVIDI